MTRPKEFGQPHKRHTSASTVPGRESASRIIVGAGEVLAFVGVVLQSLAILFQRAAAVVIDPVVGALINVVPLAILGLSGLLFDRLSKGCAFGRPSRRAILAVLVAALSANLIAPPIFLRALSLGGAVIVGSIVASSGIWAGLTSWLFLGQSPSRMTLGGLWTFLVGLTILTIGQTQDVPLSDQWMLSIPFALLVALLYGLTMTLTGSAISEGLSQSGYVGISGLVGVVGLSARVVLLGRVLSVGNREIGILLVAGTFQALGLLAATAAFARTTVVSVATIMATNVIWTSVLSSAFLGDRLNGVMAAGLFVILGGLILAQWGRHGYKGHND